MNFSFNIDHHNFLSNPIDIVFFVLSMISLIIMFYLLFLMYIKNRNKNLINEILINVNIIMKKPFRQKIYRMHRISSTLKKEELYLLWRTKFEILMEKEFHLTLDQLNKEFIEARKKFNYINLKKINDKLIVIIKEIDNIIQSIEDLLKEEIMQRDYILFYQSVFMKLKEEYKKVKLHKDFNHESWDNLEERIETLFSKFDYNLKMGNFHKSEENILIIKNSLVIFVEVLDTIPQILLIINRIIPKKINYLKDKYKKFLSKHKSTNINEFRDIQSEYLDTREVIIEKIEKSQYKKASTLLALFIKQLNQLDFSIENHESKVYKFNKYKKQLEEQVTKLETNFLIATKELNIIKKEKSLSPEHYNLEYNVNKASNVLRNSFSKFIMEVRRYNQNLNYEKMILQIFDIFKLCLRHQELLKEVSKILKFVSRDSNKIQENIHMSEVIMIQIEILVNRPIWEFLKGKYKMHIERFQEKIGQLRDVILDQNAKSNDDLEKKSELLKNDAMKLYSSAKRDFLLKNLSEELCIYLQRYTIHNPKLIDDLNRIEQDVMNTQYINAIKKSVSIINNQRK